MTRSQRHELIKYVKSRLPIFLAQIHQFLQNAMSILSSLTEDEKTELVVYLVPEIKASLGLLTDVIAELKSSLEKMYCADFSKDAETATATTTMTMTKTTPCDLNDGDELRLKSEFGLSPFARPHDESGGGGGGGGGGNNLKFVLYIYEVKKMRDIYGRVTSALDVVQQKR